MDREELFWAAGFFDGEGHTSSRIKRAKQGSIWNGREIVITITQAHNDEVLLRFQRAIGGLGRVYDFTMRERGNERPDYHRFVTNKFADVVAIIELLSPLLCSVKREQMRASLEAYNNSGFLEARDRAGHATKRSTTKRPPTDATKAKMSESARKAWAKGRTGTPGPLSEEHKERIAAKLKAYWDSKRQGNYGTIGGDDGK